MRRKVNLIFSRIVKLFVTPFKMLYAKMYPVSYAKHIGVRAKGELYIYDSSYSMFNTEPWLITLGDNVHITKGVQFITHDGGTLVLRHIVPDLELTKPIIVGDNVYIGMHSIVLPGVEIGDDVIIGAGSVVTKNIPSNTVAVGVPARPIKTIDQYLEKAKAESLHLGNLSGKKKEIMLKEHFNIR